MWGIFCLVVLASAQTGCLTPEQDAQLQKAVTIIDNTLHLTVVALKIAAVAEKDPQTKQNLQLAARIIDAVDTELVGNLTRIVEETCGTCTEVTDAVTDIVHTLEDMLTQIEPDWQDDPLFKGIVEAVDSILAIVKAVCPSDYTWVSPGLPGSKAPVAAQNSCLTPEQDQQLSQAVQAIEGVFDATEVALLIAARSTSGQTSDNLKQAAKIMRAINKELVQELTQIVDETCGTCTEVVSAVADIVADLEKMLTDIEPDWQNDPLFKAIVDAISSILDIVKAVCPTNQGNLTKPKMTMAAKKCKACTVAWKGLYEKTKVCCDKPSCAYCAKLKKVTEEKAQACKPLCGKYTF